MSTHTGAINEMKEFWNQRFSETEYIYGKQPNVFFKSVIDTLTPGALLVPGAGEGRDAVYAATKGWTVTCLDLSDAGRSKAMQLAAENGVTIQYEIGNISAATYAAASFDMITSVFFHLPSASRTRFYENAVKWLKPGGIFVMEAFTPDQLQYTSGGPKDVDLLINAGQVRNEMKGLETILLRESEIILDEGTYHKGKASVVDFAGKKI